MQTRNQLARYIGRQRHVKRTSDKMCDTSSARPVGSLPWPSIFALVHLILHTYRKRSHLFEYHVAPGVCKLMQKALPDPFSSGLETLLAAAFKLSQGLSLRKQSGRDSRKRSSKLHSESGSDLSGDVRRNVNKLAAHSAGIGRIRSVRRACRFEDFVRHSRGRVCANTNLVPLFQGKATKKSERACHVDHHTYIPPGTT